MFSIKKLLIFFAIFLLMDVEFLWARCVLAADDANKTSISFGNTDGAKATNPNCQTDRLFLEAALIAFTAAMTILVTGFILGIIGVTSTIGILLIITSIASLVGIVMSLPGYFACKWSFVRHPVMRTKIDENDPSGGDISQFSKYLQCKNPVYNDVVDKAHYEKCANMEYGDDTIYFKCLGKGDEEKGRKYEPICPEAEYETVSQYYWPKNRISRSEYIEFCYRIPLGSGLVPIFLLNNYIESAKYPDLNTPFTGVFDSNGNISLSPISTKQLGMNTELIPREAYSTPKEDDIKRAKIYIRGPFQCSTLKIGGSSNVYSIIFKAVENSDKICINAVASMSGAIPIYPVPTIGCHTRPAGLPVPMCSQSKPQRDKEGKVIGFDNSGCRKKDVFESCYGIVGAQVKSVFPVTSMVISCVKETLDNLLDPANSLSPLNKIRSKLQNAVRAVLVLALMLFAIKAILGGVQNTAEVYMLIIKFAMVIYVATGQGVIEGYRRDIVNFTIGLSDIVSSSSNSNAPCNFEAKDYKNVQVNEGGNLVSKDFQYLALWDRLDCKMSFYLGSQLNSSTATTAVLFLVLSGALLIIALLVAQNVLICLVALLTVLMIIFIAMWTVYIYILSLLGLTILSFLAPLMMPMLLFQVTKPFFDGWIKSILSFVLYPVILFAFLALVFAVFDDLYFGELEFESKNVRLLDFDRKKFVLKRQNQCEEFKESYSSNGDSKSLIPIACIVESMAFVDARMMFGLVVTVLDIDSKFNEKYVWTSLGLFLLMAFLFYHFLQIVTYLAAELSGNPRLNLGADTTSPAAMMQGFLSKSSALSKKTSGKVGDAARGLRNMFGSDSGGGSSESIKGSGESNDSVKRD